MAITAYSGVMGSGKTYEVVGHVIAPAISKGRRVVTNIAGLDADECRAYCFEKFGTKPEDCGAVVIVSNETIKASEFFPSNSAPGLVMGGDLVVVDEAWQHWGSDARISEEHMQFFRMHRHYTHPETGLACDLVLVSQTIADLHRKIKPVIELSFKAKKAKSVGMNSVYVVSMWEGPKQTAKPIKTETRRYDKKVFPLYNSYSAGSGQGNEAQVDKRQNILKSGRFMLLIPAMVLTLIFSAYYVFSFFNGGFVESVTGEKLEQTSLAVPAVHTPTRPLPGVSSSVLPSSQVSPEYRVKPRLSTEWRIAGFIRYGSKRVVLLADKNGRIRYETPENFSFTDGVPVAGLIDNERITAWSGSLKGLGTASEGIPSMQSFASQSSQQ